MGNKITIFNNPKFGEIRTAGTAEQPLFCLADVCKALDLQTGATKSRLNQKGISSINTLTSGGNQTLIFINEQNLYKVIMRSDKPQAEPFQDWVCGEVLPTIRKTGGYIVTNATMTDAEIMAKAFAIAQSTLEAREVRIKQLEEDAKKQKEIVAQMQKGNDYLNTILQSKGTVTTTQIAGDYGMSARAFNKKLHDMHIQRKVGGQWILYADHIAKGYVHSRTITFTHSDGRPDTRMQTEWTQRGRLFLYDALRETGILPLIEQKDLFNTGKIQ